jgi:hypothetical protein
MGKQVITCLDDQSQPETEGRDECIMDGWVLIEHHAIPAVAFILAYKYYKVGCLIRYRRRYIT